MAATVNHFNSLISERFSFNYDTQVMNYIQNNESETISSLHKNNNTPVTTPQSHNHAFTAHNLSISNEKQNESEKVNVNLKEKENGMNEAQKPFILLTFNSTTYSTFVETLGLPCLFIGNQNLNMTIFDFMTLLQTYFKTENDITLHCKTLNLKFRLHTKFTKKITLQQTINWNKTSQPLEFSMEEDTICFESRYGNLIEVLFNHSESHETKGEDLGDDSITDCDSTEDTSIHELLTNNINSNEVIQSAESEKHEQYYKNGKRDFSSTTCTEIIDTNPSKKLKLDE